MPKTTLEQPAHDADDAEDFQLLRRFVEHGSQEAFGQLVQRRLSFVYSVCRREVGDATLAEDVAQAVFLILARKAPSIQDDGMMAGWLFKTARFASRNALKGEMRRRASEREAIAEMMQEAEQGQREHEESWQAVQPLLQDGIAALGAQDRAALLLRYFEERSFKDVGRALGITESTARKRVERAVEKLKAHLKRHGVVIPTSLLAGLLTQRAVEAAPMACVTAITAATMTRTGISAVNTSLTGGQAAAISQGVLKAMTLKKTMTVLFVAVLASAGLGGTFLARQQQWETWRRDSRELTPQQKAAQLDRVKLLRQKWQPWALKHQQELRRMLRAGATDQSALMAVWDLIPAFPTPETGISAGDLSPQGKVDDRAAILSGRMFTWNAIARRETDGRTVTEPERARTSSEKSSQEHTGEVGTMTEQERTSREKSSQAQRLQRDFAASRDIEISQSFNPGPTSVCLWASGRVTELTELTPDQRKKAGLSEEHRQLLAPYDFLTSE